MHLLALEFVCRKSVFLHICLHHQLPSFWPSAWTYIAYVVGTLFSRTVIPIISDCNCELAFFCRHHLGASTLECFTFVSSRLSVCFCVNWIIISLARHLSAHNRFVFADCLLLNGSSTVFHAKLRSFTNLFDIPIQLIVMLLFCLEIMALPYCPMGVSILYFVAPKLFTCKCTKTRTVCKIVYIIELPMTTQVRLTDPKSSITAKVCCSLLIYKRHSIPAKHFCASYSVVNLQIALFCFFFSKICLLLHISCLFTHFDIWFSNFLLNVLSPYAIITVACIAEHEYKLVSLTNWHDFHIQVVKMLL